MDSDKSSVTVTIDDYSVGRYTLVLPSIIASHVHHHQYTPGFPVRILREICDNATIIIILDINTIDSSAIVPPSEPQVLGCIKVVLCDTLQHEVFSLCHCVWRP